MSGFPLVLTIFGELWEERKAFQQNHTKAVPVTYSIAGVPAAHPYRQNCGHGTLDGCINARHSLRLTCKLVEVCT